MATHSFSLLSIQSLTSNSSNKQSENTNTFLTHKYCKALATTFTGGKLLILPQNLNNFTLKRRRSTVATVAFSLPITRPESSEKQPKWSSRAIQAFVMAELEARKLKYPNTGTEALLMGILVEGTSLAAKFLRANGVTFFKVSEETLKLLGRSDMYYFSPEHPPLTKPAQKALDWAVNEKLKSGEDGEITVTHIALGIWSVKESAGHKIMSTLGFDDEKAKELAKFMDKDIELTYK
ncbi:ATP-dependent Clp protease ATP-binding subunit CLPT1, chloroplastic-like [Solanum stenotomum]|uniref:ATP-dependent Clp protease ATP-binding subunit CLPT1, chloroplastic-like n=1 Tax=Solanum stenotomum TaxID=172797 RepID=UPI0020CFEC68|nr:ATP-dependent Clp protease ATP-binding subunit CLPT1, chloroplastic-like [Solanum stenotomum]